MKIETAVKRLAEIVYDTRTSMNLSQKQFARLFRATGSSISNLENGNYLDLPEHRTLNRFAKQVLKIEYWELIKKLDDGSQITMPSPIPKDWVVAAIAEIKSLDELWEIQEAVIEKSKKLR